MPLVGCQEPLVVTLKKLPLLGEAEISSNSVVVN